MNVAVIAGTPVDTQMGVELLRGRGVPARGYPVSPTPEEQTRFQVSSPAGREAAMDVLLERIRADGPDRCLLYCNSLSAAIDAPALSARHGIPIWTPMDV